MIKTPSLTAAWNCDDLNDHSGNDRRQIAFNTSFFDSVKGIGIKYASVENSYSMQNSGNIINDQVVTISAWIFWQASSLSAIQFICSAKFETYEIHTAGGGASGILRFIPTKRVFLDTSSSVLKLNEWQHICCQYDSINSYSAIYINGKKVGIINHGSNPTSTLINNNNYINLGRRYGNPELYFFNGIINDLRFYAKILSETDIKRIYEGFSPLNG